jgi:quinol monooxygenase YgiN
MAVIVIAEVHGQTEAGYDGMLNALADLARKADGFVLHSAYRVDDNWRIIEVWKSKAEANQFFAKHVAPHLPPGVHPKRSIHEAHSLVMA